MIFSVFDTSLTSFDVILLFIVAFLEVLFYYAKKKDKDIILLKVVIPLLIIGLVIFVTIKGMVQDYFFLISIGILSVFYIYMFQIDYKHANKTLKKNYYKKSESEDVSPFKSSNEEYEISDSIDYNHDKTENKSDREKFNALVARIYEREKKRENWDY